MDLLLKFDLSLIFPELHSAITVALLTEAWTSCVVVALTVEIAAAAVVGVGVVVVVMSSSSSLLSSSLSSSNQKDSTLSLPQRTGRHHEKINIELSNMIQQRLKCL